MRYPRQRRIDGSFRYDAISGNSDSDRRGAGQARCAPACAAMPGDIRLGILPAFVLLVWRTRRRRCRPHRVGKHDRAVDSRAGVFRDDRLARRFARRGRIVPRRTVRSGYQHDFLCGRHEFIPRPA